ncbi:periplasmic heavy metal sensor [Niveibacterium sp. SC-1]|uniref:periplasmic heavy metal sensor n=1 Tax=Niveibacterium sp. SC-1 TaxID=3135646 RepID=UPI00311F1803
MNQQPRETPSALPVGPAFPSGPLRRRWFSTGAGSGLLAAAAGWIGARRVRHYAWLDELAAERAGDQAAMASSWMLSRIEASSTQKERVARIAREAAQSLYPLRGHQHTARARAVQILAAPTVDRSALEDLRNEQIALVDEASRRLTQAMADAAETLDAGQRAQLAASLSQGPLFQI